MKRTPINYRFTTLHEDSVLWGTWIEFEVAWWVEPELQSAEVCRVNVVMIDGHSVNPASDAAAVYFAAFVSAMLERDTIRCGEWAKLAYEEWRDSRGEER